MAEEEIGVVDGYFARIGVAGVNLKAPVRVGDTIRIRGHTTDLEQTVDSMQIEHQDVEEATSGQAVGIKVKDRVRKGDKVYKVTA